MTSFKILHKNPVSALHQPHVTHSIATRGKQRMLDSTEIEHPPSQETPLDRASPQRGWSSHRGAA